MSKEEGEVKEKIATTELKTDLLEAVKVRGESFLQAAELMLEGLSEKDIQRINDHFASRNLPLTLPDGFLTQEVDYQGQKKQVKDLPAIEKIKLYLAHHESYWVHPEHWQRVEQEIQQKQNEVDSKEKRFDFARSRAAIEQRKKKEKQEIKKDALFTELASLEDHLIQVMGDVIYCYEPAADQKEKNKKYKHVKDELDNAENHASWVTRKKKGMVLNLSESSSPIRKRSKNPEYNKDVLENKKFNGQIKRTETPIERFTDEQTQEWLAILHPSNPPEWFRQLSFWEQGHFRQKVRDYHHAKVTQPDLNLGEFLGSVPTTIRRYPGAPNGFVTKVKIPSEHVSGGIVFKKVRSGLVAPPKMSLQESVRVTRENIEQLMAIAIQEKINDEKKRLEAVVANDPTGLTKLDDLMKYHHLDLPILLQTLHSPPIQPPGGSANPAIEKALTQIRESLNQTDGVDDFLKKHHIDKKGLNVDKVDLISSNRPVNLLRGVTAFLKVFDRRYQKENSQTIDVLSRRLAAMKKEKPTHPQLAMAQAALVKLKTKPHLLNTLFPYRKSINPMAERAALEQIVADVAGIRVGSCVSGKDREEMVTQIAIAQMGFFAKHGKFPPDENRLLPLSKEKQAMRQEYTQMVSRQYLSGYGQELAGENSPGCDGLKNVEDVLSREICKPIKKMAAEYGIDTESFDPVKGVQNVAKLNKFNVQKLTMFRRPRFAKHASEKLYHAAEKAPVHHHEFDETTPKRRRTLSERVSHFLAKANSWSKENEPKQMERQHAITMGSFEQAKTQYEQHEAVGSARAYPEVRESDTLMALEREITTKLNELNDKTGNDFQVRGLQSRFLGMLQFALHPDKALEALARDIDDLKQNEIGSILPFNQRHNAGLRQEVSTTMGEISKLLRDAKVEYQKQVIEKELGVGPTSSSSSASGPPRHRG